MVDRLTVCNQPWTVLVLLVDLPMFVPPASHARHFTGGPLSGGGGTPPFGYHISAASTCAAEEVRHIEVLSQQRRSSARGRF